MKEIIHLLPDSIANQIAAGEVIQRPASVIKELMENSVDAGATKIDVHVIEAGKNLIRVVDNGVGMSEPDARMAFERHATSKISKAHDLFALKTMGFRGEALASIAAIAQIELVTRQADSEIGIKIDISGSELMGSQPVAAPVGSSFSIRNLFFNIPARRKFLKTNETEFRHIINEFERIALVNPNIEFTLKHGDNLIYSLPVAVARKRIMDLLGKHLNERLLPLHVDSPTVKITGFVGSPDSAIKRGANQFFFVNGRYMRHSYFHKSVMMAYEQLIPQGEQPHYFIYLEVEPSAIDVNIHPTKTEIKFEHERIIWQILHATVKEALAKGSAVPSIDFDQEDALDIPVYNPNDQDHLGNMPEVSTDPTYNPFQTTAPNYSGNRLAKTGWEKLYQQFEHHENPFGQDVDLPFPEDQAVDEEFNETSQSKELFDSVTRKCYQYKQRYIITSLKSGLAIVDQHRAHMRVLYDQYLKRIEEKPGVSQQLLFPERIDFTPSEVTVLPDIMKRLAFIGFDLSDLGDNSFAISGVPAGLSDADPILIIREIVSLAIETDAVKEDNLNHLIALSMSRSLAIPYNKPLTDEEMDHLLGSLFASPNSGTSPEGKTILSLLSDDELEKRF